MDIELFESVMLQGLVGGLVLFMGFIVYDLAKKSQAGKLGTIVLFGALGLGVIGFLIKTVLFETIQ